MTNPAAEPDAKDGNTAAELDIGPYAELDPQAKLPPKSYWNGPQPEGSFFLGNKIAQRTRLTPLRVPELGATGPQNPFQRLMSPFPQEEYYAVEMEMNYGKEWPRLVWDQGGLALRPGFMQPFVDPGMPAYWMHRGIARFQLTAADQTLQAVVAAAYVAVIAAVAAALYSVQPLLLAAVTLSWARNSLSLAKWGGLLALAAVDRVWIYFVLVAGKALDRVLAEHMPEIRKFCWANLALYGIYILLSPSDWVLLPGITRG
ncbi:hypothetical protein HYH03_001179 [Edaphochlamys debaryana]|uniref:Uncharacterized protein n=1 Tax=Edaphochlamys debaryana TaxID=47281 RepID=A0A835YF45_9CHLO|nr:hypothetical protein HYH03_001179 [Edaphochlamys debaryana]|eukprot:KAG2501391.1 hypothetical protein HYH03_001179 [Edaphochlamys debaryana]